MDKRADTILKIIFPSYKNKHIQNLTMFFPLGLNKKMNK